MKPWGCFGILLLGEDSMYEAKKGSMMRLIWEFPKIRGTLFGGPYHKDPTI